MGARGEVAIIDYGLGNLFSVQRACASVGLTGTITASPQEIARADGVILPGVGAFGDAMAALRRAGLVEVLREAADSAKPLLGLCLGLQLLMTESEEFGRHEGLGIVDGTVVRLRGGAGVKVPQVGWNRVQPDGAAPGAWADSLLAGLAPGSFQYFVHSYVVVPAASDVVVSTTTYGENRFCSSLARGNLFACQFHPERSGPDGLRVYENLAARIAQPIEREVS